MNQKRMNFIVGYRFDKEYGGYVSKVFNLPGCMSQGKSLAEMTKNTKGAISACLAARAKDMKDFGKSVVISTMLKGETGKLSLSC